MLLVLHTACRSQGLRFRARPGTTCRRGSTQMPVDAYGATRLLAPAWPSFQRRFRSTTGPGAWVAVEQAQDPSNCFLWLYHFLGDVSNRAGPTCTFWPG